MKVCRLRRKKKLIIKKIYWRSEECSEAKDTKNYDHFSVYDFRRMKILIDKVKNCKINFFKTIIAC